MLRGQDLRQRGGGWTWASVAYSPCGLCGRKATLKLQQKHTSVQAMTYLRVCCSFTRGRLGRRSMLAVFRINRTDAWRSCKLSWLGLAVKL